MRGKSFNSIQAPQTCAMQVPGKSAAKKLQSRSEGAQSFQPEATMSFANASASAALM